MCLAIHAQVRRGQSQYGYKRLCSLTCLSCAPLLTVGHVLPNQGRRFIIFPGGTIIIFFYFQQKYFLNIHLNNILMNHAPKALIYYVSSSILATLTCIHNNNNFSSSITTYSFISETPSARIVLWMFPQSIFQHFYY